MLTEAPGLAAANFLRATISWAFLLLQILDQPARSDDIGVLLGVALEQGIQIALLRIDTAIDFREGNRRVTDIGIWQQYRFFSGNLAAQRIPGLFGFTQLQPCHVELGCQVAQAINAALAFCRGQVDVAQLEILQAIFGFRQFLFVVANLLVEEFLAESVSWRLSPKLDSIKIETSA